MSEAEVRKSGRKALIAKMPMSRVGRARERGETQGFMKVLVDAESKRFLGAALLGIEGDEVIHAIADLMYAQRALHGHAARGARASDRVRAPPTLLGSLEPLE